MLEQYNDSFNDTGCSAFDSPTLIRQETTPEIDSSQHRLQPIWAGAGTGAAMAKVVETKPKGAEARKILPSEPPLPSLEEIDITAPTKNTYRQESNPNRQKQRAEITIDDVLAFLSTASENDARRVHLASEYRLEDFPEYSPVYLLFNYSKQYGRERFYENYENSQGKRSTRLLPDGFEASYDFGISKISPAARRELDRKQVPYRPL